MDQNQPKEKGIARRAAVGLAKGWAYSLGFYSLREEGQRIAGAARAGARYVRRKLADGPHNHRHETFEEAVVRLTLTEDHLERRARDFRIRTNSNLAAFFLALGWSFYLPWTAHPYSSLLIDFGLMIMTYANAFCWHFRVCQIRDRELYSFQAPTPPHSTATSELS